MIAKSKHIDATDSQARSRPAASANSTTLSRRAGRPRSTTRACAGSGFSRARLDPRGRPGGVLALNLVFTLRDRREQRQMPAVADVAECDESVPPEPARLLARHVEALELVDELASVTGE